MVRCNMLRTPPPPSVAPPPPPATLRGSSQVAPTTAISPPRKPLDRQPATSLPGVVKRVYDPMALPPSFDWPASPRGSMDGLNPKVSVAARQLLDRLEKTGLDFFHMGTATPSCAATPVSQRSSTSCDSSSSASSSASSSSCTSASTQLFFVDEGSLSPPAVAFSESVTAPEAYVGPHFCAALSPRSESCQSLALQWRPLIPANRDPPTI